MELRHLRYFVAVVDCRGYREAARRLHVAQPALTQSIHDLEAEIGSRLLNRDTRPVTLTRAGTAFYGEAKRVLSGADEAIATARRAEGGLTGDLSIGFIPGAARHFLPALLEAFTDRHPTIALRVGDLTPSRQLDRLLDGELDVGFTREPDATQQRSLSFVRLFAVPLIAFYSASHPVAGNAVTIESLEDEQLILLEQSEAPQLYDDVVALCKRAGFRPKIKSQAFLAESMMTLVEAGEGIALLPAWARCFLTDKVRTARIGPDTVWTELVAAWRTQSESAPLDAFLTLVRERSGSIHDATQRDIVEAC